MFIMATLIALVAAEFFLRCFWNNPRQVPQQVIQVNNYEYSYTTSLNNFGFRDEDFHRQKEPGTFRIFLIGDSFVYSPGVADDYKIDQLLENKLNQTGNKKFEVYNLGLPSAGTSDYVQIAKNFASYRPDLIILSLYTDNDVSRFNIHFLKSLKLLELWRYTKFNVKNLLLNRNTNLNTLDKKSLNFGTSTPLFVPSNNQPTTPEFYRQLADEGKINIFLFDRAQFGDNQKLYDQMADKFTYFSKTKNDILKIRKIYKQLPFILLVNPSKYQVATSSFNELRKIGFTFDADKVVDRKLQDVIIGWAEKKNIQYIDPLPTMLAKNEQSYYYTIDDHYNEAGDKLISEIIYNTLFKSGFIGN